MGLLLNRANEALDVNPPPPVVERLSVNGSNWLWAVVAIYTLFFLGVYAMSFKPRGNEKIFHYLLSIALLVGAITYFANASDLGWSLVSGRQIFFTKYINWVVSFAVVNILLGLVANMSWATIVWNIFLSWVWVISYLVSAYTSSDYKWGFFAFGTVAYLALAVSTFTHGRVGARRVGTAGDYWILAGYFNLLWLLYPIAFGVSEGGNTIGVTPHFIFFGILDIFMIPFGAVLFLILSRKWDYNALNLYFTQYGRVPQGGHFPEKSAVPAPGPGPAPAATPATTAAV
ncbi:heat shock protein 30 [Colletotrichum truncatum]|uniref:Heat shock protein 30 n=1 Tax=Colletotrichum truncatum TaxID=5467 RepID=A0ACC3Z9E3_COLTU|nr:heat shock protein 30 [Colletotrichum truncatum]KAF6793592.1 heat shock protein 30 [Colletotrichum truncatum]